MSEPKSQAVQVCKCGCGTVLDLKRSRTDRQFVNASHRARYHREQACSRIRREVERGKLPAAYADMADELVETIADLERLGKEVRGEHGQGLLGRLADEQQQGREDTQAIISDMLLMQSRSWCRQLQFIIDQLKRFDDAVLASQVGEDEPAEVRYLVNVLGLAFSWEAADETDEDLTT